MQLVMQDDLTGLENRRYIIQSRINDALKTNASKPFKSR